MSRKGVPSAFSARRAPVRIMGVINVSPESFYKGSVKADASALRTAAREMAEEGADAIDVGAMSTAPYLTTNISEREEANRLAWAVPIIRSACRLPISVDTSRCRPAEAGHRAGATILNDVTGLRRDPALAKVAQRFSSVVLMAHPTGLPPQTIKNPVQATLMLLKESLAKAETAGIPLSKIILDPGIGFFRTTRWEWWDWDLAVLKDLRHLTSLGRPLLVGVSRKSFISHVLGGRKPEDRLAGSLGAAIRTVDSGASIIRTHDVKATRDALRMTEAIKNGKA